MQDHNATRQQGRSSKWLVYLSIAPCHTYLSHRKGARHRKQVSLQATPWLCTVCNFTVTSQPNHSHTQQHITALKNAWLCDLCSLTTHPGNRKTHIESPGHQGRLTWTCNFCTPPCTMNLKAQESHIQLHKNRFAAIMKETPSSPPLASTPRTVRVRPVLSPFPDLTIDVAQIIFREAACSNQKTALALSLVSKQAQLW